MGFGMNMFLVFTAYGQATRGSSPPKAAAAGGTPPGDTMASTPECPAVAVGGVYMAGEERGGCGHILILVFF